MTFFQLCVLISVENKEHTTFNMRVLAAAAAAAFGEGYKDPPPPPQTIPILLQSPCLLGSSFSRGSFSLAGGVSG